MLIIGTSCHRDVLREMGLASCFASTVHVSMLNTGKQLIAALQQLDVFEHSELEEINRSVAKKRFSPLSPRILCLPIVSMETKLDTILPMFITSKIYYHYKQCFLFPFASNFSLWIGIKKLIFLAETARQVYFRQYISPYIRNSSFIYETINSPKGICAPRNSFL